MVYDSTGNVTGQGRIGKAMNPGKGKPKAPGSVKATPKSGGGKKK